MGDNVRRLRMERRWTQEQLARRLRATSSYVGQLERTEELRPKAIERIAKAFNVNASELLAGVVTEYDRIRGASEPTPQRGELRRDEEAEQLLSRWNRMDAAGRKLLLDLADRLEP